MFKRDNKCLYKLYDPPFPKVVNEQFLFSPATMILSKLPFVILGLLLLPACHAAASLIEQLVDSTDPITLYEPFKFVGDGSSGRVYKARIKQQSKKSKLTSYNGKFVAVKIIPLRNCKAENITKEVAILKSTKPHRGIVKYLSSHVVNAPFNLEGEVSNGNVVHGEGDDRVVTQYVWIVTKWIDGINLSQAVDDHASAVREGDIVASPAFEASQVRNLAGSLFKALKHLHDQGILHGDIDISNIMVVDGSKPILLDLGNADNDPSRFDEDIVRMTYALVEMSMKPIIYADGFDDGPVNVKLYDTVRKVSTRIVLEKVQQKEWEVPEDLYELVTYVVGLPELTLDVVMQHPYFGMSD